MQSYIIEREQQVIIDGQIVMLERGDIFISNLDQNNTILDERINPNVQRDLNTLLKRWNLLEFFDSLWDTINRIWESLNEKGKKSKGEAFGKLIDTMGKACSIIEQNKLSVNDISLFEATENKSNEDKKEYIDDPNNMFIINVKKKGSEEPFKAHGSPFTSEEEAKDKVKELEKDIDNNDRAYEIQKLRK